MDVADTVSVQHHADVVRVSKKGRIKWVQCRCAHLSLALDAHERHLVREALAASHQAGVLE